MEPHNNNHPDNNGNVVEPYDMEIQEIEVFDVPIPESPTDTVPDTVPDTIPEIDTSHEIDLSGYHYDLVPTYKMIQDPDDQDTLFRIQFLQAFGITDDEYHPEIVSAVIDDLYERFRENLGIREILKLHPLYQSGTAVAAGADTDPAQPSQPIKEDNSEMIFCMMFSFQLFDLFHACIRHAKHKEDIPQKIHDEIVECFRTMF
jgi:hypothetical protein